MKHPATPQLEKFSVAYLAALLAAVQAHPASQGLRGAQTVEEYVVGMTAAMVQAVQRSGAEAIIHYHWNAAHGVLRAACRALGIHETPAALDVYLGGAA